MQTEGALLRLPPPHLLARPSPPRGELGAEGTGADPQGHYSTTTPVPAISSSSQGQDLWGPSHHPLQEGRAPPLTCGGCVAPRDSAGYGAMEEGLTSRGGRNLRLKN